MAINIYIQDSYENIDYICDDDWELPGQIYMLGEWLKTKGILLPKGAYIADIGFCVRKDASGGGGVITTEIIELLNKIGMEIYLSEYRETPIGRRIFGNVIARRETTKQSKMSSRARPKADEGSTE